MGMIRYIEDPAGCNAGKEVLAAAAKELGLAMEAVPFDSATPAFEKGDLLVYAANGAGPAVVNAVLLHVLEGGKILFFGDGMKMTAPHELVMMTCARLLRELPYGELTVSVKDDPVTEGFGEEDIWDKAMIFERSVFDDAEALISAVIGRNTYPLVWRHRWYLGEVFCMGTAFYGESRARFGNVLKNILRVMEV